MRHSTQGPKLILSKANVENFDDDLPEEPDEFETTIVLSKKIKYKQRKDDRFDSKGRRIVFGTGYTINFDNFITVCVFDPEEEVVQIRDTLSQLTEQPKASQRTQQKHFEQDNNEIILLSILKKGKKQMI